MTFLQRLAPRTLRARLILLVLAVAVIAQALLLFAVGQYQRNQAQAVAVNLLVTSIRTLQTALAGMSPQDRAEFVRQASGGAWELIQRDPPRGARFQQPLTERRSVQEDEDPGLRRSLRSLAREVNQQLGRQSRVAVSAAEQPYLFVSLPDTATEDTQGQGGRPGRIMAWLKIPLDRVDPPVNMATAMGWFLSLLALLLVGAAFSWHITKPLTELLQATEKLAAGQPQPVVPSGPDETRRLGERFNDMLAALEHAQQTQRTLLAGLPHDLKGPLARMALRIEMTDDEQLKSGLSKDLEDLQKLVDQFVAYIRGMETGSFKPVPLELEQWLKSRIADLQQLGYPVQIKEITRAAVMADPGALERLVNNLVDNALHHGRPPVEFMLGIEGTTAVMTVQDHGDGIAESERQRAMEPFVRLDPARTRTGSSGLGLSIVSAIAKAHGASVELGQADSGGLKVVIKWPLMSGH